MILYVHMKVEFISLNNLLYKNCLIHRKLITLFIGFRSQVILLQKWHGLPRKRSIYLIQRKEQKIDPHFLSRSR